ncbi:MAG: hypothetical protein Q9216_002838 [Gyalolechia sp. 2 TL-2023]
MADMVLYEEVPRPYKQPPQMPDPESVKKMTPGIHKRVQTEVIEMFGLLQLVLDPLAMQIPNLRRRVNMDDLLRKLKWYVVLFRPIIETNIFTLEEKEAFNRFRIQEKFPNSRKTKFLWKPLHEWCREHRMTRLRLGEQKAYGNAFRAYEQALRHVDINHYAIGSIDYTLSDADMEGFRQVVQESPVALLTLPTADDVGFAMDVKGMAVKDACARCLTQRLGGSRLLGQRPFEDCLTPDSHGFWKLFTATSCGEIITNAFACRVARAMSLGLFEPGGPVAE